MSVRLNEPALQALLESQDGPVGQLIEQRAAAVVAAAQANVRAYFAGAPSLDVDQDVSFEMDGSSAVIGIQDGGSKSQRIARYQAEGRLDWLRSALDVGRE